MKLFVIIITIFLYSKASLSYEKKHLEQLINTNICINCDLTNADLSKRDLNRAKLSGSNLSNAKLSSSNLSYADLSFVNLTKPSLIFFVVVIKLCFWKK